MLQTNYSFYHTVFLFQPQAVNTLAQDLSTEQYGPTKLAPLLSQGKNTECTHTASKRLTTLMKYISQETESAPTYIHTHAVGASPQVAWSFQIYTSIMMVCSGDPI